MTALPDLSSSPRMMRAGADDALSIQEIGDELFFAAMGLIAEPDGTKAVFRINLRDQEFTVTVGKESQ